MFPITLEIFFTHRTILGRSFDAILIQDDQQILYIFQWIQPYFDLSFNVTQYLSSKMLWLILLQIHLSRYFVYMAEKWSKAICSRRFSLNICRMFSCFYMLSYLNNTELKQRTMFEWSVVARRRIVIFDSFVFGIMDGFTNENNNSRRSSELTKKWSETEKVSAAVLQYP